VGSSGVRWFNSLGFVNTVLVNPSSSFILPFSKSFLGTFLNDFICFVDINGTRNFYATSNSTDNQVLSSPPSQKIIAHTPLYSIGLNNSLGSNTANNSYMAGGIRTQGGSTQTNKVFFSEPTPIPGTVTFKMRFVSYTTGVYPLFNTVIPYAAGVTEINAPGSRTLSLHYISTISSGFIFYNQGGFVEVTLQFSDPNMTSLLNVYHWGVSN
jgi:hypothetical protein